MTECVQEMEETRREMFKVAKTIIKLKDDIVTNKTSSMMPGFGRQGSHGGSNNSSPNKNFGYSQNLQGVSPIRHKNNH